MLYYIGANSRLDALRKIQPLQHVHSISMNLPYISFTTSGLKKIGSATLELSNPPTQGRQKPIKQKEKKQYVNNSFCICTNVH